MNQYHVHQVVHVPCVWVQEYLQPSAMGFKLHKGHHQACSHLQPCSGSKDYQTTYFVGSKNFFKGKVTIYHHGININEIIHHVFLKACHHQQGNQATMPKSIIPYVSGSLFPCVTIVIKLPSSENYPK